MSADQLTAPFCWETQTSTYFAIILCIAVSVSRIKDSWPDGRCHSARTSHQDSNFIWFYQRKFTVIGKLPSSGVSKSRQSPPPPQIQITTTTNKFHIWRKSRTKSSIGFFGNFPPPARPATTCMMMFYEKILLLLISARQGGGQIVSSEVVTLDFPQAVGCWYLRGFSRPHLSARAHVAGLHGCDEAVDCEVQTLWWSLDASRRWWMVRNGVDMCVDILCRWWWDMMVMCMDAPNMVWP